MLGVSPCVSWAGTPTRGRDGVALCFKDMNGGPCWSRAEGPFVSRTESSRSRASGLVPVLSEYPIAPLNRSFLGPIASVTVRRMRRHRARGGLWPLVYLALRHVLGLVVVMMRSESANQVELLALHHEIAVLRRQVSRPVYQPADRALLAAMSPCYPKTRLCTAQQGLPESIGRGIVHQSPQPDPCAQPDNRALRTRPAEARCLTGHGPGSSC
jgi:hypothetical protein